MVADERFRILAVCTGNVCRSPLLERLLQAGLNELAPGSFDVASAGTFALTGAGIAPPVVRITAAHGASTADSTARQLTPPVLDGQNLILALDRDHRSRVVEVSPHQLLKTFTLLEFARILPAIEGLTGVTPSERWRAAVLQAPRLRAELTFNGAAEDVADPYGKSVEHYEQMANILIPAVRSLLDWERRYH